MTGRRCGRLLVTGEAGRTEKGTCLWRCRCECGNDAVVLGTLLRGGQTASCGCLQSEATSRANYKSIAGQVFGKLTAIERVSELGARMKWRCRCECGNEAVVARANLASGNTTSCGCESHKSGPEHPSWKPHLKPEERVKRRDIEPAKYRSWHRSVMERDGFTCVRCGQHGGLLCAHHLDGWNWCRERRYDVDNGVTLCDHPGGCHKQFHTRFGKGGNTREQFSQFLAGSEACHAQAA